jgi:hypothetical protein
VGGGVAGPADPPVPPGDQRREEQRVVLLLVGGAGVGEHPRVEPAQLGQRPGPDHPQRVLVVGGGRDARPERGRPGGHPGRNQAADQVTEPDRPARRPSLRTGGRPAAAAAGHQAGQGQQPEDRGDDRRRPGRAAQHGDQSGDGAQHGDAREPTQAQRAQHAVGPVRPPAAAETKRGVAGQQDDQIAGQGADHRLSTR